MSARLEWRRGFLATLALAGVFTLVYVAVRTPEAHARVAGLSGAPHAATLDIASGIYVANLPRRADRRRNMTMLAHRLGAQLTFVDAIDMRGPAARNIMNHVRLFRQEHPSNASFAWPTSGEWIEALDWTAALPAGKAVDEGAGLTCSRNDWEQIAPENAGWEWVHEGRVACWETHVRTLRHIAGGQGSRWWTPGDESPIRPADVAIILEDDVDAEADIRERLAGLWPSLPTSWDMVFFGASSAVSVSPPLIHTVAGWCWVWSGETKYPAIGNFTPAGTNQTSALHPSDAPQCTHAYAVSIPGARKLLSHLEYPPFAYSRAIDQAYVHLLQTGRIRAFSVAPALVIQRKQDKSDIAEGATWMESLFKPALGVWRDPTVNPCVMLGWCGLGVI
jgi:GR25 family glycosyltransferase involved in LPS biosynthesis